MARVCFPKLRFLAVALIMSLLASFISPVGSPMAPTAFASTISNEKVEVYVNDLFVRVLDSNKYDENGILWVASEAMANDFRAVSYNLLDGSGFAMKNDYYEMIAKQGDSFITVNKAADISAYTVSYNANGGGGSSPITEILKGTSHNTKASDTFTSPDAENLEFREWNTAADGTGTSYAVGEKVPFGEDITLYAIWGIRRNNYTVSYNANGGHGLAPTEANKENGQMFSAKANTYTAPAGKGFKEWNTQADSGGSPYAVGASIQMPRANIVLYAIWENITLASPAAPSAPLLNWLTDTSVTVKAPADANPAYMLEYAVSADDNVSNVGNWQTETAFDTLTPDTTYYFFARYKGNPYKNSESGASTSLYVKTLAEGTEPDGSETKPFQITSEADLENVGKGINGWDLDKYYILINDIAMSSSSFTPIGAGSAFTGSFDGQGYVISGLTISSSGNNIGLFAQISNSTSRAGIVKNLGLEDVNITGGQFVGGLAGIITSAVATAAKPLVENSYVTGTVTGTGTQRIGGFVGIVQNGAVVKNCYAAVDVTASSSKAYSVGGFAGAAPAATAAYGPTTIENSYGTGTVINDGSSLMGGLIGETSNVGRNTAAIIDNNVALNPSIRSSNIGFVSARAGRIGAPNSNNNSGTRPGALMNNNYAYTDMEVVAGATYAIDDGTNNETQDTPEYKKDGLDASVAQIKSKSFWEDTVGFDFINDWEWSDNYTPKLKNVGNPNQWPTYLSQGASYAVTYNANEGEGEPPIEAEMIEGVAFATRPNSFTHPWGGMFKEWNTTADGSGASYAEGDTIIMPDEALTLYAIWEVPSFTTMSNVATFNIGTKINLPTGTQVYREGDLNYIPLETLVNVYKEVFGEDAISLNIEATSSAVRAFVTLDTTRYAVDNIPQATTDQIKTDGLSRDGWYEIPVDDPDAKVTVWRRSTNPEKLFSPQLDTVNSGFAWVIAPNPQFVDELSIFFPGKSGFVGSVGHLNENESQLLRVRIEPTDGSAPYEFQTTVTTKAGRFGFGSNVYNEPFFRKLVPYTNSELMLRATFENISVYFDYDYPANERFDWKPTASWVPSVTASIPFNTVNNLEYRKQGETNWEKAMNMMYDDRYNNFRGSILGLEPGTTYEVRLTIESKNIVKEATITTLSEEITYSSIEYDVSDLYTSEMAEAGKPLSLQGLKGTADAWIRITNKYGIVINATDEFWDAVVLGNSEYVELNGLIVRGGLRNGITVHSSAKHIRIVNVDVSGFGRYGTHYLGTLLPGADAGGRTLVDRRTGWFYDANVRPINSDAGIRISDVDYILVEKNYIHDPKGSATGWGSNSGVNGWSERHPLGVDGLYLRGGEGVVIRYNDIVAGNEKYWSYGLSTYNNSAYDGGMGWDSDLYGNFVLGANADGLEVDGGSMNVRVYGNKIEAASQPISFDSSALGPIYVFRNLITNQGDQLEYTVGGLKHGTADANSSHTANWYHYRGLDHVFNNTIILPEGAFGARGGIANTSGLFNRSFYRNNIIELANPRLVGMAHVYAVPGSSFDYDISNGAIQLNTYVGEPREEHGFTALTGYNGETAKATFVNPERGDYRLMADSIGVDDGWVIPNFSKGYKGDAPDIGALEYDINGHMDLLPYRPIDYMNADGYELKLEGNQTKTIEIFVGDSVPSGMGYTLLKNNEAEFFTVKNASGNISGTLTAGVLTLTITSDITKIKEDFRGWKYPLGKGAFIIKLDDGNSVPVSVYVKNTMEVAVQQIVLNADTTTIFTGDNRQLIADVLPGNATDKSVVWTSSDSDIASVDQNGLVTAYSDGKTTITATIGSISATCEVTVKAKEGELIEIRQADPIPGTGAASAVWISWFVLGDHATPSSGKVYNSNGDQVVPTLEDFRAPDANNPRGFYRWQSKGGINEGVYTVVITAEYGSTFETYTATLTVKKEGPLYISSVLSNEQWVSNKEVVLFSNYKFNPTGRIHIEYNLPPDSYGSGLGWNTETNEELVEYRDLFADGRWVWTIARYNEKGGNPTVINTGAEFMTTITASYGGITEKWHLWYLINTNEVGALLPEPNGGTFLRQKFEIEYANLFVEPVTHEIIDNEFVINFKTPNVQSSQYGVYVSKEQITPQYQVIINGVQVDSANISYSHETVEDGAESSTRAGQIRVALPEEGLIAGDIVEYVLYPAYDSSANIKYTFNQEPVTGYYSATVPTRGYNVIVRQSDGGTLLVDKTKAMPGETVTITAIPDQYGSLIPGSLKVNGGAIAVSEEGKFIMPNEAVLVTAEFEMEMHSVIVNPQSISLNPGDSYTFSAQVAGDNNPTQEFTWVVTGSSKLGTTIVDGVLTIAADETAETLTIKATSVANPSISGMAVVTVPKATYSLSLVLDQTELWPANNKMVPVQAKVIYAGNSGDIASVSLTSVTSNEPADNYISDAVFGMSDYEFKLRATRLGNGTGRIYTIEYTVTFISGEVTTVKGTVKVPHDQSKKK